MNQAPYDHYDSCYHLVQLEISVAGITSSFCWVLLRIISYQRFAPDGYYLVDINMLKHGSQETLRLLSASLSIYEGVSPLSTLRKFICYLPVSFLIYPVQPLIDSFCLLYIIVYFSFCWLFCLYVANFNSFLPVLFSLVFIILANYRSI